MSASRRKFTTECKVEAANRVIDSGLTIAQVARTLIVGEQSLSVCAMSAVARRLRGKRSVSL